MLHSPQDRSSDDTMSGRTGTFGHRREKFLQRVVDQIEVDRLCRNLRRHFKAKDTEDSSPPERSPLRAGVAERSEGAEGSNDRQPSRRQQHALKRNVPPRSKPSPLFPALGQPVRGTAETLVSRNVSIRSFGTKGKPRKVPRIRIESPHQKSEYTSENHHVVPVPSSTCPTFRGVHLKSSGLFYGVKPTPLNPGFSHGGEDKHPPRTQMFSWKICTPTNWKRAKSYHEILLERRFLRRNGRQPSPSKFYSVFTLRDARKVSAGDRIRRVLRRARFYGDDIKRLVIWMLCVLE